MGGKAVAPGRGRKPKPTARKKAAGNPGKRELNKNEPEFDEITNIDPPEYFQDDEFAWQMWERVAPLLCDQKVLTLGDLHNLELFCDAYGRWRRARVELNTKGLIVEGATGGPVKNPAATIINEASRQMATFGSLLGLDPASRSRLTGGTGTPKSNPYSSLL
jgi:P27 family predicted phage terminase small subunit